MEPDPDGARVELEMANTHLASADLLVQQDPVLAYTALYDAARKAISAHMRVQGLRPTMKGGKHINTFAYARAALGHLGVDEHLARLEQMRDTRHLSEYEARTVSAIQTEADLAHAKGIVAAIDGTVN